MFRYVCHCWRGQYFLDVMFVVLIFRSGKSGRFMHLHHRELNKKANIPTKVVNKSVFLALFLDSGELNDGGDDSIVRIQSNHASMKTISIMCYVNGIPSASISRQINSPSELNAERAGMQTKPLLTDFSPLFYSLR